MQPKSIPEPVRVEHERTPARPFPLSGDNFVTVTPVDALEMFEAFEFVHDMQMMLAEFHRLHGAAECTGTVESTLSDTPELASKSG